MVDKRPQRAAPQVGAKVVQIPGQNVSVSCAARTAPAHDARARLATWPRRGGTQHGIGLEHEFVPATLNHTLNRTEAWIVVWGIGRSALGFFGEYFESFF